MGAAGEKGGLPGDFPPLCFFFADLGADAEAPAVALDRDRSNAEHPPSTQENLGMGLCGELWVLLLLLLPEHLRAAISEELAGPWIAQGIARAVRGPWALPLEALRETLGHV